MMERKRQKKINYKFELGCWMTVYNRPDLLIDATTSLLKCKDLTGIKFVICDDGSTDKKINNIIVDLKHKLNNKGNYCEIIGYSNNQGKAKYHKTLKECFKELSDCRFIMPLPPDFIFNPYLFQVARKCFQYINETVKAITFSIDKRFLNITDQQETVDDYFTRTKLVDWGPGIFEGEFVKEFVKNMRNLNISEGTGTTHTIWNTSQEKGYELYQYKESLCQHIGNENSVMNMEFRKKLPLTMGRVNLERMPEILSGEVSIPEVRQVQLTDTSKKRICVVKSCGIGNIVCITPIIRKLKELYPDSFIDLLVENNAYRQVLIGWKLLRDIYIDGDQANMPEYDIIIDGLPSKINISNLKGNKYTGEAEWYMKHMHEVEANMRILRQVGWDETELPRIPKMTIPQPPTKKKLDKEFKGKKYIGISAGFYETMSFKNWGYKKYAELIERLIKKYSDYKILIFGINKDKKIIDYITDMRLLKGENRRVINCVDSYTIQETVYLISKCKFMVANDTGLSHASSCVGVKCYTLFGMTPPKKALPWGYGIEVSLNLSCSTHCYYEKRWADCQYKKCLEDMSVDFVFNRIVEKDEFELGIIMATYNRYELLVCTLNSILSTFDEPSVKISFINDGSDDKRINEVLFEFSKVFKGKVVILNNDTNKGRMGYPFSLRRAWNQLYDCKYILFMPDDAIINRYTYQVIRKSYKYFGKDVKCINYFRDSRMKTPYSDYDKKFFHIKPYDKYFDVSTGVDGFLCLFENKFLKTINWNAPSNEKKTNFWRHFHWQLKDYKNLLYKETLCNHIGNIHSVMWSNKDGKRLLEIKGIDVNLWDVPMILSDKTFEYSAEWYSECYHKKGAYNLPDREYNELQNEWETLGYKKRFYEVLDDVARYIDFKEIKSVCEVGCHHGKSVFWMRERFPEIKYDAFDFSKVAIDWCRENNPYENIIFQLGDVRDMPYKKKFDLVMCLDVGEHLPEDIYFEMIEELKRISGRYILWYVGRTKLEEHINLKSIEQQRKDLKNTGSIIEMPHYHLLIQRKNE
jgi:ADP-heptose:LPS heptosyltransferase/GT2 family glycosyltransferase